MTTQITLSGSTHAGHSSRVCTHAAQNRCSHAAKKTVKVLRKQMSQYAGITRAVSSYFSRLLLPGATN